MRFTPPCCPHPVCPSRSGVLPFRYHRRGSYRRRCDDRFVPKFACLACGRGFSLQSFRLDHRLRKPWLNLPVAQHLCAKVTLRKMAEILGVRRPTVERRLLRFGEHARAFHEHLLECQRLRGGLRCQTVQMDELETYETDRRLQPVTVPVLIDPRTFFILHIDTAPMPARGGLRPRDQIRRQERERRQGRRKSGSRSAVLRTLQAWKHFGGPEPGKMLQSDKKQTYRAALRKVFGAEPVHHATVKSGVVRNRNNLLFPINHTNALLRDSVSRLVRRTWAASKKRRPLEHHLWLFVIFRNYIREITRRCAEVTSATALGVTRRKLGWSEVLRWRAPFFTLCRAT